jgi:peptidoglycan-associated lipoprotein
MKKIYLIISLFLVIAVGAFTGCDKKQLQSNSSSSSATDSGSMSREAASSSDVNGELNAIYFDYNKYDLRAGDKEILKSNAGYLLKNKKVNIIVQGNCDERGSDAYNLDLGAKRAQEAKKYLVSLGVDNKRIKTISYGKRRPIDKGHDEDAWAKNRRDDFVVSKK